MKRFFALLILMISVQAWARPVPLSGRVVSTDNLPVESQYVSFRIAIGNASTCILYEETHDVDMSFSNGYFKLAIFTGTPTFSLNGGEIFIPKTYQCRNGTSWTASANDVRVAFVSIKIDSNPWVDFASEIINALPYSIESEYLKGKGPLDFIQVNAQTTQSAIDGLISNGLQLSELAQGTSTIYAKQVDVNAALALKQNQLAYVPINPANNLSELTNKAQARTTLGLGTLALRNSLTEADITGLSTSLAAKADVSFVNASLNSKVNKSSFTCGVSQTITYVSVTDSFTCNTIQANGDIGGAIDNNTLTKIQGKNLLITSLQDKQSLVYNLATDRWENRLVDLSTQPINTSFDITAGNIKANKQIVGTSFTTAINANAIDFSSGNTALTQNNCASAINLLSLRDGATYTLVNTDSSTTARCNFTATDISGVSIKFSPENDIRESGKISVYSILRAGNYLFITWNPEFN